MELSEGFLILAAYLGTVLPLAAGIIIAVSVACKAEKELAVHNAKVEAEHASLTAGHGEILKSLAQIEDRTTRLELLLGKSSQHLYRQEQGIEPER